MSSTASNLEAISKAIDLHDGSCDFPAVAVAMNPYEAERLGWDEIRGLPIEPDPNIGTGRLRIVCEQDRTGSGISTHTNFRVYEPNECGTDGYPFAWHSSIKHLVREQAGHRCVRCLHPYEQGAHGNGEWSPCDERCMHFDKTGEWITRFVPDDGEQAIPIPVGPLAGDLVRELPNGRAGIIETRWRILTVHHLNGDKRNCRWWNLASLCQRCHLTIQGKVQMPRVYPFEHSEWFKPYAAGFYASSYNGEELTREQAAERQDELLALERVA